MTRILVTALMLLLPVCAAAQTVVVRSGAHDGFTRLVLDMPDRIDWRLVPRKGGASVSFAGPPLSLDLDRVFERISRDRLRAASVVDGRLELEFACACETRSFWHGARMLVLDIVPKPQPQPESASRPQASPLTLPVGVPRSPALTPLASRLDATLASGGDPAEETADDPTNPPGPPDLSAIRTALLEQLARAASQGLLTPAPRKQVVRAAPEPAGQTREMPEADALSDARARGRVATAFRACQHARSEQYRPGTGCAAVATRGVVGAGALSAGGLDRFVRLGWRRSVSRRAG